MYSLNRTNINSRKLSNFWCHQCKTEFIPANCDMAICPSCDGEFCEEISTADSHPKTFDDSFEGNSMLSSLSSQNSMNNSIVSPNLPTNVSNLTNQIQSTIARLRLTRALLDQLLNFNQDADDYEDGEDTDYNNLLNSLMETDSIKGPPPASKEVVKKLPKRTFSKKDHTHNLMLPCSVCKDDFNDHEEIIDLPCKHYYHANCILPWLDQHNSCPTCRDELPTDDLDYEKMKESKKHK